MSFINKSVDYCQTILLKTKFLKPLLTNYNNFLIQNSNTFLLDENKHYIPNNNNKYYCLIIKKNQLEDSKDNYNILYFFNEDKHDFYLEMSCVFNETILLEGYLYDIGNNLNFLTTDILIKNNEIVQGDYKFRYTIINELFYPITSFLSNINNNISIGIHAIFNNNNKNMMHIFKNNFKYKKEICGVESIDDYKKTQYFDDILHYNQSYEKITNKTIEKTNYTDVYNVFDEITKEFEGILYVKGVYESNQMKILFKTQNSNSINNQCKFNKKFNKWEPVLI